MMTLTIKIKWMALMLAFVVAMPVAAQTIQVADNFESGRLGPQWDPENYPQNTLSVLDELTIGDAARPGVLTVRSRNVKDSYNQVTFIMRSDVRLDEVGDFAQVDVRHVEGIGDVNVQAGLGLATRSHGILRNRSNTLMYAFRGDGIMRANSYSMAGTDLYDYSRETPDIPSGAWATLRVVRSSPNHFQLWFGPQGQPDRYLGTVDYTWQEVPTAPGLMLGNGLADMVVQFDNFLAGHMSVEPRPTPPPLPAPVDPDEQVTLSLPDDVMTLPKAPSERYVVHMPSGPEDMTCHHGAIVQVWKDRVWVAWHALQEGEDSPPYVGMIASAPLDNLEQWTPAKPVTHLDTSGYEAYMRARYNHPAEQELIISSPPRTLHATPDRLYLFCLGWVSTSRSHFGEGSQRDPSGRILWTDNGEDWHEIPQAELDRMAEEEGLAAMRHSSSNHHFARLRDGRLMAFTLHQGGLWCPTTTDPTGLSGWHGGLIDSSDCDDVGEPGGWQGPDGVLHGTARYGERIWHAFSRDGGRTWSKLTIQPRFPDCPGNKDFEMMDNGSVLYVGNPVVGSRDELVISISADGWNFDQTWLARWEPTEQMYPAPFKGRGGYQYPDATIHDGKIYIAYSVERDYMELTVIEAADLFRHTAEPQ